MRVWPQLSAIRSFRDVQSWIQHVITVRNLEDVAELNRLDNRLTVVENAAVTIEKVQDNMAGFLVAGDNVTLTYNDTIGTLTIAASGGGGNTYFPSGW